MSPGETIDLDLRGLKCPLPALRVERALAGMEPGERLAVLADDPMAAIDIPHFCRAAGHALLVQEARDDGAVMFCIAAGPDSAEGDRA